MIGKICGVKARFCSRACLASYREDRLVARMIYPGVSYEAYIYPREEASILGFFCAYCFSPSPKRHRIATRRCDACGKRARFDQMGAPATGHRVIFPCGDASRL